MPYPLYGTTGATGDYIRLQEFRISIPELTGITSYGTASGEYLQFIGGTSYAFSNIEGTGNDHGSLDGLEDDDHGQYFTTGRADTWIQSNISLSGHTGDTTTHFTEASIDHGSIAGLSDDDHGQYFTTGRANTWLASKDTDDLTEGSNLYYTEVRVSANTDVTANTSHRGSTSNPHSVSILDVGGIASGTFTGHSGDSTIHFTEVSIDHTAISNVGSNSHSVIDSHLASTSNPHSVSAAQIGSPTNATFTTHTGDATVHFTEGSIDHAAINNIGSNSHATIDSHLASSSNPHSVTASQVGSPANATFTGHTGDASIHFTEASIDHGNIVGLADDDHTQYHTDGRANTWLATKDTDDVSEGGNLYYTEGRVSANTDVAANTSHRSSTSNPHSVTAAQVDSPTNLLFTGHTGDTTVHFTEASVDHGNIIGLGDDDHTQYLLADGTRAMAGDLDLNGNNLTGVGNPQFGRGFCSASIGLSTGNIPLTSSLDIVVFSGDFSVMENGFTLEESVPSSTEYDSIYWNNSRSGLFQLNLKSTVRSTTTTPSEMRIIPYTSGLSGPEVAVTSTICYASAPGRDGAKSSGAVAGAVSLLSGHRIYFKQQLVGGTEGAVDNYGIVATLLEVISDED